MSAQRQPHPRLLHTVRRHLAHDWRQPLAAHTQQAFDEVQELLAAEPERPVVLDSGCGTGISTLSLAKHHPDCMVIGIDQSVHRLGRRLQESRFTGRQGRSIWVRAELASFWRLALSAKWRVRRNYLLYPNPWPKAAHLGRRWHGHPVFPDMLRLSESLELRTNWRIYAEEFALAIAVVAGVEPAVEAWGSDESLSPFERKYRRSGHSLYRVVAKVKKSPGKPGLKRRY